MIRKVKRGAGLLGKEWRIKQRRPVFPSTYPWSGKPMYYISYTHPVFKRYVIQKKDMKNSDKNDQRNKGASVQRDVTQSRTQTGKATTGAERECNVI